MFRSLRLRIAASHALVLIVILVGLGLALQLVLARSLDRAATNELTAIAQGQVTRIREAGVAVAPEDSDIPSAAGVQVAVWLPNGDLRGEPREVPSWLKDYRDPVTNVTVDGEPVRVISLPARVDGRPVASVTAGRSLAAESNLLHRVRLLLLAGGAIAVVLSLLAGWWLAGRAVRPVQQAYDAQSAFAADASHELRTPLTFIRTGVEVFAERDPDLGRQVLAEVDYMTGLTQRLLLLARAEGSALPLDVGPVDVNAAATSAAHRSARAHGNRLTVRGAAATAIGDRIALEAVLDAILENVARHGGGAADVDWRTEGGEVVLRVADHGSGIPEALQGRAFDRFFRVDPSRARDTGGAGLGLGLARSLVHAQNGRIWLSPTPGGGLTVEVGLPAV